MKKQARTKKQSPWLIAGLIILVSIVVFAAFILINRQLERQRFLSLDRHMQELTRELNAIDPSVVWTYEKGCEGYGTFNEQPHCETVIRTEQSVKTTSTFTSLFMKSNNLFSDHSSHLTQTEALSREPESPKNPLENTELSSRYKDNSSNIDCLFWGRVTTEATQYMTNGTPIPADSAHATISLRCTKATLAYWYQRTDFNRDQPISTF